jgi:hypothetical protein
MGADEVADEDEPDDVFDVFIGEAFANVCKDISIASVGCNIFFPG